MPDSDQEICAAVLYDSGYRLYRLSGGEQVDQNGYTVCLASNEILEKYGEILEQLHTHYVARKVSPQEVRQWS